MKGEFYMKIAAIIISVWLLIFCILVGAIYVKYVKKDNPQKAVSQEVISAKETKKNRKEEKKTESDVCTPIGVEIEYPKYSFEDYKIENLLQKENFANAYNNIDIRKVDNYDKTPLHKAVEKNDLKLIKYLILNKADLNAQDKEGKTPLHYAAIYCGGEMAALLCANGADMNIKDSQGNVPLITAINWNNKEMAILLIENGAQFDTAILERLIKEKDAQLVKLLLEQNKISAEDLSKGPLTSAIVSKNQEMIDILKSAGAMDNITGLSGKELLHSAVSVGDIRQASSLLAKGVDVNSRDNWNRTPLWMAAINKNIEMAKLLIENGAEVNVLDKDNKSALYYPAQQGDVEMVKFLISKGANVNLGDLPINAAIASNQKEIVKILIDNHSEVIPNDYRQENPLCIAAAGNKKEIMEMLISAGADVNGKNRFLKTPLDCARTEEAKQFLLAHGAR